MATFTLPGRSFCVFVLLWSGLLMQEAASEFGSADEYFDAWHAEDNGLVSDPTRIYPFHTRFFDNVMNAESEYLGIDFETNFPFLGRYYHKVYGSRYGIIGFNDSVLPSYDNQQWPNQKYPDEDDPPGMMAYFAYSKAKANTDFYKSLDPEDYPDDIIKRKVVERLLFKISHEVQVSIPSAVDFQASFGVMMTWYQIEQASCFSAECPKNTFQAIMVSDGERTFAEYNYYALEWHDSCSDNCYPPQVGFNVGYGRFFIPLPHSKTEEVLRLATYAGAMGVDGRYIFEVTKPKMTRGGCINDMDASNLPEWPIEHFSHSPHMLGGSELIFTSLCPDPGDVVEFKFGWEDADVVSGYVVENLGYGCIPPIVPAAQQVQVWFRTQNTDWYSTYVEIDPYIDRRGGVKLVDHEAWYDVNPETLSLTWNPDDLHVTHPDINTTTTLPPIAPAVNIKLYAYRERQPEEMDAKVEMVHVHTLEEEGENDGEFVFNPEEHRCQAEDCDWHVGAVQVSLANVQRQRVLWSRIVPLGWFVYDDMHELYGEAWPEELCREWASDDDAWEPSLEEDWKQDIQPCPCNLPQALADVARWIIDPDCDFDPEIPIPCPLHPSADICLIPPRPSPTGGQSRCCYKNGHVMYIQDDVDGGFPGKVYQEGVYPYRSPPHVPTLSHWVRDKIPYFWCCRWTPDPRVCHTYFSRRRPTKDCKYYKEPRIGAAYGDPHFHTFDGNSFLFNGQGEFWMLRSDPEHLPEYPLQVQARAIQPINNEFFPTDVLANEPQATIMTAVSMQEGASDPTKEPDFPNIQVLLNPRNPPEDYSTLSVYVGGEILDMEQEEIRTFKITGGDLNRYVRIQLGGQHKKPDNVTIIYPSDTAVQVSSKEGVLHVLVFVPPELFEKTQGLFGLWNADPEDDLRPPNYTPEEESYTVDPQDPENVHDNFGLLWNVSSIDTLFHYFASKDWEYYNKNLDFRPNFSPQFPPDPPITDADVNSLCGEHFECRFDYMTTLNRDIASETLGQEAWVHQVTQFTEPLRRCPVLEVEHSVKEVTHYLVTGQVRIIDCYEGYTLQGDTQYTCVPEGENGARWSPSLNAYCEDNEAIRRRKEKIAIGVSVPLCLLAAAAFVFLGVFLVMRRKKLQQEKPVKPDPYSGVSHDPQGRSSAPVHHGSKSSINSHNSIILTQELHAARPPRPRRGSKQSSTGEPETMPPTHAYDNMGSDVGHRNRIERPPMNNNQPAPGPLKKDPGRYTSKESLDEIFDRMGEENPAFRRNEPGVVDSDTLDRAKPAPADPVPVHGYQNNQQPFPAVLPQGHYNPALADTDEVDDDLGRTPERSQEPPYPYRPRDIFVPSNKGANSFV